jgi:hypothetical protein
MRPAVDALVLGLALLSGVTPAYAQSDEAVRRAIIQDSIANYPGPCACPYNTDRRGHSCGKRSAYSRPGGYSPICYPSDVTPKMIREYVAKH